METVARKWLEALEALLRGEEPLPLCPNCGSRSLEGVAVADNLGFNMTIHCGRCGHGTTGCGSGRYPDAGFRYLHSEKKNS